MDLFGFDKEEDWLGCRQSSNRDSLEEILIGLGWKPPVEHTPPVSTEPHPLDDTLDFGGD